MVGVFIGFILAVGWDLYKNYKKRYEELARSLRFIEKEIGINLILIDAAIIYLDQDNIAADQDKVVVKPLSLLVLSAGETVWLQGSLDIKSTELSIQLKEVYDEAANINFHVQNRELYRLTNAAMTNFSQRRKMVNDNLKVLLQTHKNNLETLLKSLKDNG